MDIDYDYLIGISKDAVLYTNRKTTNILDGGYSSLYMGKSLEFHDLKDYTPGDDITSIDWKCSSRTDSILVRRYIAEKKHTVLIIGDTGAKMDADTRKGDHKSDIALMTTGVLDYLLGRQGADVGFACSGRKGEVYTPFLSGGNNVEKLLHTYGEAIFEDPSSDMNSLINATLRAFPTRRMIIFVITDLAGLRTVESETLLRMSDKNDVYFVCIDDAPLTGRRVYDRVGENYVDGFLSGSRTLKKAEERERNGILDRFKLDALRNRIVFEQIRTASEVVDSVITMFERGRSGIYG
ncbi:MAG: DUF58 domain-containing protein [Lachnospiraceae bacterium]|nr:DUF58 domain-containing protein [Lachnospiraceae bacterium]